MWQLAGCSALCFTCARGHQRSSAHPQPCSPPSFAASSVVSYPPRSLRRLSLSVFRNPAGIHHNLTEIYVQTTGSGSSLAPLVNFYSKLPKGPRSASASGGIKGRFFNGKNASGAPLLWLIGGIFGLGYTIDYQSESSRSSCR